MIASPGALIYHSTQNINTQTFFFFWECIFKSIGLLGYRLGFICLKFNTVKNVWRNKHFNQAQILFIY